MTDCTCPPDAEQIVINAETRRPAEMTTGGGRYVVYPEDLLDADLDIAVACGACGVARQLSRDEWEMS